MSLSCHRVVTEKAEGRGQGVDGGRSEERSLRYAFGASLRSLRSVSVGTGLKAVRPWNRTEKKRAEEPPYPPEILEFSTDCASS